ncbi:hypothetical protein F4703DRAFT_1566240 [Phycomyces blakesleeanus]
MWLWLSFSFFFALGIYFQLDKENFSYEVLYLDGIEECNNVFGADFTCPCRRNSVLTDHIFITQHSQRNTETNKLKIKRESHRAVRMCMDASTTCHVLDQLTSLVIELRMNTLGSYIMVL